jgi:hypothetical protein
METKRIKQSVKPEKPNNVPVNKTKSRTSLLWDVYLSGVKGEILDMRAVLK